MKDVHTFQFGIFDVKGNRLMALGTKVTCNHSQASIIRDILDSCVNDVLRGGDFVACDLT